MHRHFCSYSNQRVVAAAATAHWCYTPQFWDVFFRDMRLSLVAHPSFVPRRRRRRRAAADVVAAAAAARGGRSRAFAARRARAGVDAERWAEMRP